MFRYLLVNNRGLARQMNVGFFLFPVVIISMLLTGALRKYALTRQLMDIPNSRSSHTVPTPRGGGVAIVIVFLVSLPLLYLQGLLQWNSTVGLLGSGLLVALIGFLDDHGHVAARWRLLGHFIASIWALYWLGGFPNLLVFGSVISLGWVGFGLAVIYLVWMLNLYNFMDGIDGIASVEAIFVCVAGCLLYWLAGGGGMVWGPLVLAFAVAGFLYWNFPPARIFMGDAGSGFLGLTLGVFSVQATSVAPQLFWGWLTLLGVFIVDATWTLFRRLLRGEKIYEAHRSHAYQHASRQFGEHRRVTLAVLLLNLVWLLPISIGIALGWVDGLLGTIIAYIPLISIAVKFKAGQPEA
jgi:Fuc2NAc and GlcNAc transferase